MSIYSVKLYKINNVTWVFDDPNKNIVAEAFVAGADTMLDMITRGYDPGLQYILQFSTKDYPGAKMLTYVTEQDAINDKRIPELTSAGTWWQSESDDHVMWLGDTLHEYVDPDDTELYFSVNISKNYSK